MAERVAHERGEQTGDTVGYHIRLEQKTSDNTVLTYCTSGVLLRILSADPSASGITHIILDEVHEREQNTDYLLIILREALKQRDDLKIILMSATIEGNREMFEKYFNRFKPCGRCDSKPSSTSYIILFSTVSSLFCRQAFLARSVGSNGLYAIIGLCWTVERRVSVICL